MLLEGVRFAVGYITLAAKDLEVQVEDFI